MIVNQINFISFGCFCQPAYQIRRFTGIEKAYFFAWLITPIKSIGKVLRDFDSDHFLNINQPGGLPIADHGIRVLDLHTGVKFQHEFSSLEDGTINISSIRQMQIRVKEKYIFLRNRTLNDMQSVNDFVYIRFEWPAHDGKYDEVEGMNKFILEVGDNARNRLFVLASESVSFTRFEENKLFFKLSPYVGDKKYKWHGDDLSWDKLFELSVEYFVK
jgi:hypothetical protein